MSTPIPGFKSGNTFEDLRLACDQADAAKQAIALLPADLRVLLSLAKVGVDYRERVLMLARYGIGALPDDVRQAANEVHTAFDEMLIFVKPGAGPVPVIPEVPMGTGDDIE